MATVEKRRASPFDARDVKILRLETVVAVLALSCLVLIGFMIWERSRPTPVCYGTAEVAPGLVRPGHVPDRMVRVLAEHIVQTLYNVTPSTAEEAHARVRELVHPGLLTSYDARRAAERSTMKVNELSTTMILASAQVGLYAGEPAARLEGVRTIYVGSVVLREENLGAVLRFERVYPTEINPYGLMLRVLEFTEPLRAEID